MHTVDKAKWKRGEWDQEPDFAQWDTPEGFHAIMLRMQQTGHLNGYIGVPPGHPWHGKGYDTLVKPTEEQLTQTVETERRNIFSLFIMACNDYMPGDPVRLDVLVKVHGGITFANYFNQKNGGRPGWWYFGFDTAHCDDMTPGMTQYDWAMERGVYRNAAYVWNEINYFSRQFAKLQRPWINPEWSRNQREGRYMDRLKKRKAYA